MSSTASLQVTTLLHKLEQCQAHATELERRNREQEARIRELLEARNRDLEDRVRDLTARNRELEGSNQSSSEVRLQQLEERNRQLEGQLQVLRQEAEERAQQMEQHMAALQRSAAEARRLARRYEFDEGEQLVMFVAQRLLETWDPRTQHRVMRLTKATYAELLPRMTQAEILVGQVCRFPGALGLQSLTLRIVRPPKTRRAYPDAAAYRALECQLQSLQHLTGLTTIHLNGGYGGDLKLEIRPRVLAHHHNLLELHIGRLTLVGLQHLSPLTSLTMLEFEDCEVDCAQLPTFQSLRDLRLDRFSATLDMQQLARQTMVQRLHIGRPYGEAGQTLHFEQLAALTGLLDLRLYDRSTAITSLEPLHSLTSLTRLVVHCRCHPSLELLAPLTRLQNLELEPTDGGRDLSQITTLQGLRHLHVFGREVHDLTPLTQLTALEYLRITASGGTVSVAPLTGLRSLRSLVLYANKVPDLELLASLHQLKVDANLNH